MLLLRIDAALAWWAFPIVEGVCLILAVILFKSAHKKHISVLEG